ncbi:MAG TPA: translocation/assembly module TamB domain-containing protein [Chitinophagaceae bacterium]|jgi:hypothetical protein|nr:translocation/assembly module TamB domain-containing protein [Chitinophagaceae bacterium]
MSKTAIKRTRLSRAVRIILKSFLFILLFIVLVFLLLLTPPAQRYITTRVENYLEKKLQTRVDIGRITFDPFGNIKLKNVYLEDRQKDTLLNGALVKAKLNILKLFSNTVRIKDIRLSDITAHISRDAPDSAFNFQFIVDAFTPEPDPADTGSTAVMEADINMIRLENTRIIYRDAVTGTDMDISAAGIVTELHSKDLNKNDFTIPVIDGKDITVLVKQVKPLAAPEPLAKDIAQAMMPMPLHLLVGNVNLQNITIRYDNDVSAMHANVLVGILRTKPGLIDLQQRKLYLDEFNFENSTITIRTGKKEQAAVVAQEIKQEIVAQQQAGWDIRAAKVNLEGNSIRLDNNTKATGGYGINYDHLQVKDLVLSVNDLVLNNDSIGGKIMRGSVKEENSGFVLEKLEGDILYAGNQAYAKDVLIKTPGTEIKRSASLSYASKEELARHFERTVMTADIDNSYVLVKDILMFAPQLRRQKAFSNPADRWELDINGNGTFDRLVLDEFRFDGLLNTQIDASGTLTGLSTTSQAGGNFTIRRLHTTQTDISLFTGKRLSTTDIRIPEDITMNGTIAGNSGRVQTKLNVSTSSGSVAVNGIFSNIADPVHLNYDAVIRTSSLNLGKILPNQDQLGVLSGNFIVKGSGTKKENANAAITAAISTVDYNQYRYQNIKLDGWFADAAFTMHADINDPNADADLTVKGNLSGNSSYVINGMVDSLKTQPLHLTPGPLIARGKIEGTISNITADNIDADLLISKGLFVAGKNRLPLDTIQLKSGRNDSVNYLTLRSDIATIDLSGQYRLNELGTIVENSIRPYFSIGQSPVPVRSTGDYNFRFTAGIQYSPIFSSLVPGLVSFDNISAEGSVVSGSGLNASVQVPSLVYKGNEFYQLSVTAARADSGLKINAVAASIKSGSGMSLYNTRISGLAANNTINFTAATDDQAGRSKYRFGGLLTSAPGNNYTISLSPDNLLLNYELWSIASGNRITITPNTLLAENFVLQKDNQQLRISSADIKAGSLEVQFTQFRLATITGFMKNDSLAADGVINGDLIVTNLLQMPSFTGRLTVNDLSIQRDTIGNVGLQVIAGAGNRHTTTATLTGRGNDVVMTGYFIPGKDDIATAFDIDVRQLQLKTLEGALAKALSDASGSVNGKVRINGSISDPVITGDIGFNNASFIPNILGTRFRIGDQKLSVTENGIAFNHFIVQDSAGNKLELNGKAITGNFIDYEFDLAVTARNFQVLNTVKGPGKIYYGKLNVSANLRIKGDQAKPRADGTITVNDGTSLSLVIPQAQEGVSQRDGIVEFVDMDAPENDSLFLAYDSLSNSGIFGFDVTTTIEIKKEAVFNIIVDESNGDFLNVQGEAQLSAGIDPSGKITLGGNYTLDQGSYQLSFNFLRRKFDIQKGSNIVWTGEPTTARLDIKAVYLANTAPLDLVSSQLTADVNRNIYLQKLPFEVHLDITGELLKPVIDFDILLPEKNYGVSNDIVTAVQQRLTMIRQDEGEINKQVFSLLLLNRFVGENPFESGTDAFSFNSYARQSVSKLLTEQLNQLAAGLIGGVDIDFDVISADDYTTGTRQGRTDLSVGLSKRLLSNRLKITVGSNFQLEGPQSSNQQSNNIAGNVAADYQLSKDGRYVIRFYRQNEYQGIVDGYIIETGVSFIFSVDYERFMQIFRKRKRAQPAAIQNNKAL